MAVVGVCTGLVEIINTEINNGKLYVWVSTRKEKLETYWHEKEKKKIKFINTLDIVNYY